MSISAVQILQKRLILSAFKEAGVTGQKTGVRLHTSAAWFFKAINYAYDVQINGTIYTLNAESFDKWRQRVNAKLIRPLILSSDINSKTIQKFFNDLFAPLPPIPHSVKTTVTIASPKAHPSLSPDHVANDPSAFRPHLFASSAKEGSGDRYARLAKERKEEEEKKARKALALREKAKKDGTLHQTIPKKIATEEERAQARFLLGLADLSD